MLHNREEGLIQIHEPNFMVTSPGVSSPDVRTYFHHDSTKRLNHNATLPSSFLNRSTSLVASLLAPSTSFWRWEQQPSFLLTSSLPSASFPTATSCEPSPEFLNYRSVVTDAKLFSVFLDGLKNIKKISFDAPFFDDSEYHNINLIAIRERSEKNCFVGWNSDLVCVFNPPCERWWGAQWKSERRDLCRRWLVVRMVHLWRRKHQRLPDDRTAWSEA